MVAAGIRSTGDRSCRAKFIRQDARVGGSSFSEEGCISRRGGCIGSLHLYCAPYFAEKNFDDNDSSDKEEQKKEREKEEEENMDERKVHF